MRQSLRGDQKIQSSPFGEDADDLGDASDGGDGMGQDDVFETDAIMQDELDVLTK